MHEEDNLIGHMRNADGTGPLINDAEAVERRAAVRAIARGLPEPATTNPATTPVVEGLGMLAAHSLPSLNIERLDKDAMQNTLSSMMAMADAQRRRFDAAGVLVLVFDATGMGLTCFSRPDRGGISDEYAREHFAQLAGVEPMVRRVKAKRKR